MVILPLLTLTMNINNNLENLSSKKKTQHFKTLHYSLPEIRCQLQKLVDINEKKIEELWNGIQRCPKYQETSNSRRTLHYNMVLHVVHVSRYITDEQGLLCWYLVQPHTPLNE